MAQKHQWDNATKLAKLVEALEDNALTFYSSLDTWNRDDYHFVKQKFNARFGPKEPPHTARNQLSVLQLGAEEGLEEFAEHAQCVAMDAFGDLSRKVVQVEAMEAFLQGARETEAALSTIDKGPETLDKALEMMKIVIHN